LATHRIRRENPIDEDAAAILPDPAHISVLPLLYLVLYFNLAHLCYDNDYHTSQSDEPRGRISTHYESRFGRFVVMGGNNGEQTL
jgi:hypothetical protein